MKAPVSTNTIRALYLEQRWPPRVIAHHLGTTVSVVKHRLREVSAITDPRAALPFRRPPTQRPVEPYVLASLIRDWVTRDGRSINAIARSTGMNCSNLSRVVNGQRGMGTEFCGALARALELDVTETDRLYVAAGHAPPTLIQLGGWTEAVACFCRAEVEG